MNATMLKDLQLANVKQPGVFIFIDSELIGDELLFTATKVHWDSRSQCNRNRGQEIIKAKDFSTWWVFAKRDGWEVQS